MSLHQDDHLMLSFGRRQGTVVIAVRGDLDAYSCPKLNRSLRDLIDDQGHLAVDLDLSSLEFIDSSGVQLLLGAHRRLQRKGGQLCLRGVTRNTERVLEICGLAKVFSTVG